MKFPAQPGCLFVLLVIMLQVVDIVRVDWFSEKNTNNYYTYTTYTRRIRTVVYSSKLVVATYTECTAVVVVALFTVFSCVCGLWARLSIKQG